MITSMHMNVRVSRLPRRPAAIFAILPAALLVAGLAPGIASAAPGDDITEQCLEYSQGGGEWVKEAAFEPTVNDYTPIPGGEGVQMAFDVRNTCDTPATLVLFSQNWVVTDGATATVKGAIDGQQGQKFVIGPDADATTRIELIKKPITQNTTTGIEFLLGIPWPEETQGFDIDPGWGLVLVEDEPAASAPAAPTAVTILPSPATVGTPMTIKGKAEANATVTVTVGSQTCTSTADAQGDFSCTITPNADGTFGVTATATNATGTGPASTATSLTINPAVVDPVAPAAPTDVTVTPADPTVGDTVTIKGKAEAGSTVTVTASTQTCEAIANADGNFSCTIKLDKAGDIDVSAKATNAGGTGPASAVKTITVKAAEGDTGSLGGAGSLGGSVGSLGSSVGSLGFVGSFGF